MDKLNKDQIRDLLPHREPMLLVDDLYDIKKLQSSYSSIIEIKRFISNSFSCLTLAHGCFSFPHDLICTEIVLPSNFFENCSTDFKTYSFISNLLKISM